MAVPIRPEAPVINIVMEYPPNFGVGRRAKFGLSAFTRDYNPSEVKSQGDYVYGLTQPVKIIQPVQ